MERLLENTSTADSEKLQRGKPYVSLRYAVSLSSLAGKKLYLH